MSIRWQLGLNLTGFIMTGSENNNDFFTTILDKKKEQKPEIKKPSMFKVLFHNDNYTTFEFVEDCLVKIFKHTKETAKNITKTIHVSGVGVAGIYTLEIAEHKALLTMKEAKANGYPLLLSLEKE